MTLTHYLMVRSTLTSSQGDKMSKTFNKIPLDPFNQVKVESLQDNRDGALDQFNGNIDGTNIEYESLTLTKFKGPEDSTGATGAVTKETTVLPSQTIAISKRNYNNTGGAVTDIWTRINGIDLQSDVWEKGFNKMTVFGSDWATFPLLLEAKEGILTGEATIDWEHGNQVFDVTIISDPDPVTGPSGRGGEWWTNWGVFVNGILIAQSGWIFPRRHTTRIPFSVPVGSQTLEIDVRFIANSWEPADSPGGANKWSADFNIFSATIVARNIYR